MEALINTLSISEAQLEQGYGKLAYLIKDISDGRYWQGEYESFNDYLDHLREHFKLGRTQLYQYFLVARDLDGVVNEKQLSAMGIEKAKVLRKVANANTALPKDAITVALNPKITVKELRKLLFTATKMTEEESGAWYDLEFEFAATDEERATFRDAINAAIFTDPPISNGLPDHVRRKEIALRWAQEFLASHPLTGGE